MADYELRSWTSRDGLRLCYRDYAGPDSAETAARPALLCLHGLTRNARDFAGLADRLGGQWRLIVPEMRGRGDSDYARDPMTYNPEQYAQDLEVLLAELALDRFVAVGTSMGGLLSMMLAAANPARIAGAVLNDIGPVIDPVGLARIRAYVGQGRSFETWMHAARALQESQRDAYPDYGISDWLAMAKRLMVLGSGGRIAFDYDMKIGVPFEQPAGAAPEVDLWPLFDALAQAPMLIVRGERSDILSAETAAQMAARAPRAELFTLPRTGHAPTLDEPECAAAIDRLLAQVA